MSEISARRTWIGIFAFCVAMAAMFLIGLLMASVMSRRGEARRNPPAVAIDALESDSHRWAVNWPRQYDSYLRMKDDSTKTTFGGGFPRDYLAETPLNVVLFAGYGFSKEYRQARGHVYAIEDVTSTKRLADNTPATCWTCKSPDVPRLMVELGRKKLGNPKAEFESAVLAGCGDFYGKKFSDYQGTIKHPIGCLDCHEPETMRLRITRPALIEALARRKIDVDQVTHQEMRTLVCAQCHVEYYFKGEEKHLTFPWDEGLRVEQIEKYYAQAKFSDWTHAISKAPMVKIQHPDYEVYQAGIHAYRNVACADCHMPYRTEGAAKFTDHHVQSPLLNVANSCAVCHRWSEDEIQRRVVGIQTSVREGLDWAERAISFAHYDIAACMEAKVDEADLGEVRDLVRQAQIRWDYVAANNGMGFHAPQECQRILTASVDLAQQCRLQCGRLLAKKGFTDVVHYPDDSTKEKAQSVIRQFVDGKPPMLLK